MALPQVENVEYPTPEQVLNQLLNDVRYMYAQAGVDVNVTKGSELYMRMKAVGSRVSIAINNNRLSLAAISPLTATGDDLDDIAGVYGVSRRAASSAYGNLIVGVDGSGSITIPAAFVCTSPDGIQYETTQSFTVFDGDVVTVVAQSAGSDTDQIAGVIVTWNSAIIGNLGQNAEVDPGGIDGGEDEDTDEELRARLIQKLGFPATGGNWAQVAQLAEGSSSSVQSAFVYPAVRGPSSYDVALTKVGTDRQLSIANVNFVAAAILNDMPGTADLNCTSVTPEYVDVIVDLMLPLPVNAGGVGGGWRDSDPWPSSSETGLNVFAEVTSVANLTTLGQITVNSTLADPPKAGDRFGIWNPAGGSDGDGEMAEYTVLSVGGVPSAYIITIDTAQSSATSFIQTGMYCSAGASNLISYGSSFLEAVQGLGPGEKTSDPDIIPRGSRKPGADVEFPVSLSSLTLAAVSNSFDEIMSALFAARFATGTTVTLTSPSLPPTTADAPNILVLRNLSFRRLA